MAQEIVTLECTEAKALGKPPSRGYGAARPRGQGCAPHEDYKTFAEIQTADY